jgi:hypothetical protein
VDQANSAAPLSVLARRGIGIGQRPTLDELHAQPLPCFIPTTRCCSARAS